MKSEKIDLKKLKLTEEQKKKFTDAIEWERRSENTDFKITGIKPASCRDTKE